MSTEPPAGPPGPWFGQPGQDRFPLPLSASSAPASVRSREPGWCDLGCRPTRIPGAAERIDTGSAARRRHAARAGLTQHQGAEIVQAVARRDPRSGRLPPRHVVCVPDQRFGIGDEQRLGFGRRNLQVADRGRRFVEYRIVGIDRHIRYRSQKRRWQVREGRDDHDDTRRGRRQLDDHDGCRRVGSGGSRDARAPSRSGKRRTSFLPTRPAATGRARRSTSPAALGTSAGRSSAIRCLPPTRNSRCTSSRPGGSPTGAPAVTQSAPQGQSVTNVTSTGSQQIVVQAPPQCEWVVKVTGYGGA